MKKLNQEREVNKRIENRIQIKNQKRNSVMISSRI